MNTKALFKPRDPVAIANYIVKLDLKHHLPITNIQLSKIAFFLQGYFLKKYHTQLIAGNFIKWRYGPVNKDIYSAFKYNDTFHDGISLKKPAVVIKNKNDHIICYEPLIDKNLIPNRQEFNQLIINLTKLPTAKLIELSQQYENWKTDKYKIYHKQELPFNKQEIITCFNNYQKEFC